MPIRQRYQHAHIDGARVGKINKGINTTFIVYRIGSTLIDTGPSNQWASVNQFISEKPADTLLISHHHEDHSGNAKRISDKYQLTPYAPEQGRQLLANGYSIPLLQKLVWGNPIPVNTQVLPEEMMLPDGTKIKSIHTPGHAIDLHCFYLTEHGFLFSGDLYISKSLKYLRADENLAQLIDSIRKACQLDFEVIFCPHRGILTDGKQALLQKLDNIVSLCQKAQHLHQSGVEFSHILKQTLGKEDIMRWLTRGDFCKSNLLQQALTVNI